MPGTYRYVEPTDEARDRLFLVPADGSAGGPRFALTSRLEIGRDDPGRQPAPGLLLVVDPTVSFRHCVLSRSSDGRCTVRDVSRNGTRVDGRRLVPNVEEEVRPGQTIEFGTGHRLLIEGGAPAGAEIPPERRTTIAAAATNVTIVIGDVRDYTVLVRRGPRAEVQDSVNRVFARLAKAVEQHGGSMKEYQGDAIFAFWEGERYDQVAAFACRAALALDALAQRLAGDPAVWTVPGIGLRMDWALASGSVRIDTLGGARPTGLSMVGDPVALAFRLEKFATEQTGRILACPITRELAREEFAFRDLGRMHAKGFEKPDHVYALEGPRATQGGAT